MKKRRKSKTYSGIGFLCFSDLQLSRKTVIFWEKFNWRRRRSWDSEGRRSL